MMKKVMMKVMMILTLSLTAIVFVLPAKAQVTIGANKAPQSFSLLELISNAHNGLRLPQIADTNTRNAISDAYGSNPEMKGLQIFNMETLCVETWNGSAWISICAQQQSSQPPIVAPETNPTSTTNNDINISTYVNAMYDFQHQTLTAYLASGAATAYQWQISKDGNTWYDIVGATQADFVVPADFMYSLGNLGLDKNNTDISSPGNNSIEIQFRCQITSDNVTDNTAAANILSMLFIRTNTINYGESDGIRYLTIQKGQNGINDPQDPGIGSIKIALLNLGQSGTGAWFYDKDGVQNHKADDDGTLNDAGDLGDLYQWGRIADGHEHIVWSKDASYNIVFGAGTSGSIAKSDTPPFTYTAQGQIPNDATDYYGKFIYTTLSGTGTDWGNNGLLDLWGNGNQNRSNSPADLSGWSFSTNNPCPGDWYVPSIFDLWDIFMGNGTGESITNSSEPYTSGIDDRWTYRANATSGKVIGGILITNRTGEQVFVPASGWRQFTDGSLMYVGLGCINSSTRYQADLTSWGMTFISNSLSQGYISRSYGMSIRCVKQ